VPFLGYHLMEVAEMKLFPISGLVWGGIEVATLHAPSTMRLSKCVSTSVGIYITKVTNVIAT